MEEEPSYTKYFQNFTDEQKKVAIKFFNYLLFGRLDYLVMDWFDTDPKITYNQVEILINSPFSEFREYKLLQFAKGD
jgi:hypothetical protein